MNEPLVVVGVLARVEPSRREEIRSTCEGMAGVSTFAIAAPDQIGLLIEASDLDAAHACLRQRIDIVPGVLGTWPVAVEMDTESQECPGGP